MHTILTYIIRTGLGAIGLTAERAVSIACRMAWIIIEILLVLAFLYIVAFLSAGVGMMVVERVSEYRVDTIQGKHSRLEQIRNDNR